MSLMPSWLSSELSGVKRLDHLAEREGLILIYNFISPNTALVIEGLEVQIRAVLNYLLFLQRAKDIRPSSLVMVGYAQLGQL